MKRVPAFRVAGKPVYSVHDAALAFLESAVESLQACQDDESVHAARKATKCVRAALRLMRTSLGSRAYHRHNRLVRDAAKPLTAIRDAFVLQRTLGELHRRPASLRRTLLLDYQARRADFIGKGWQTALAKLRLSKDELASMPTHQSDTASAIAGARKVYRSGRLAFADARSCGDEMLHEWRKQAKYLLNALALIRAVFNVKFKKRQRRAHALAQVLGDDHDLAVLAETLRKQHMHHRPLDRRINKRRHSLQRRAQRLGVKLYRFAPSRWEIKLAHRLPRP
jgi:CHAD domain-containing protein